MVNEVGEMDSVSPDDHNNSGISVFEIDSPDYKLNFLSWILDITQEEADKGFEFLKRNNKSIEVLWDLLENLKVFTVVVEDHYVDRVYRDSYYFYYSGKHFSYTRFCKRLSIFDGKLEKNFFDYYIESGIPVAIGLKIAEENKHSIICIGHMQPEKIQLGQILNCANNSESDNVVWVSDTADLVDTYCFMDDNKRPYNISECVEVAKLNTSILSLDGFEVEYMMVPLYKRMILEAADAYDICMSVIASPKFGIKSFSQEWDSETKKQLLGSIDHELGTKEEPLVIRLFMASSRTFRKKRDTQFNVDNKEIQDYYNMTVFPKFVWVCEISSKALYENQQVLGEIIIDATSSPDAKMDSIIIVNYPYALCRRMPEDFLKASEACFEEVKEWKPYDIFRGNLTDCQSL